MIIDFKLHFGYAISKQFLFNFFFRKSHILSRKSYIQSRKSYILPRKSYTLSRKSYILSRKSYILSKKSHILSRKADFLTFLFPLLSINFSYEFFLSFQGYFIAFYDSSRAIYFLYFRHAIFIMNNKFLLFIIIIIMKTVQFFVQYSCSFIFSWQIIFIFSAFLYESL